METPSIRPLIDQLEGDIDDLEEALQPLLQNSLDVITQKLPVLDKAKLYVLLTYAIESLIFCVFPNSSPWIQVANANNFTQLISVSMA
jgi:hypothetical protein